MVRYSLKQLLRSPLKTGLFFLLLAMTACLLFLGVDLWEMNQKVMKEFEDIFVTIGTVQQKKSDSELKVVWDELTGKNTYYHEVLARIINLLKADAKPCLERCYLV